uniref:RNA-binding protein 10-like n=1 Tax=Oncorhynchus gorbuscha TaxID=8017 RepID=UPI001EAF3817
SISAAPDPAGLTANSLYKRKAISVEFAKGSKRDVFLTDGSRVSAATAASTAIAAAQWSVTQKAQSLSSTFRHGVDVGLYHQGAAVTLGVCEEEENLDYKSQTVVTVVSSEAVVSGVDGVQLSLGQSQSPLITTATTQQVEIVGKPQPPTPTHPATPGTAHEYQQYPVPDVSTYQYEESSGFYYDPLTGLCDPNSQVAHILLRPSIWTPLDPLTGLYYDPLSGLYYDPLSGLYYDPLTGLYYDPLTGLYYDPLSGLYYDPLTGLYYDPLSGLYYDPLSGLYYDPLSGLYSTL